MKRENITVSEILKVILSHIKLIIVITLVAGILAFLYAEYMITPLYTTSTLLYVTNSDELPGEDEDTETDNSSDNKTGANDISISEKIASVCVTLFRTDLMMQDLIDYLDLEMSTGALKSMISVGALDETQFISFSVTSTDPEFATEIANALPYAAEETYKRIFPYGSIIVADSATVPSVPSYPNVRSQVMQGLLIGLVLSLILSFVIEIVNTTVKPSDDLYKLYNIPVFAKIPDIDMDSKRKNRNKRVIVSNDNNS